MKELVLQAAERLIPARDLPVWLNESNCDLDGRTPQECLDHCAYEALIEALWLMDRETGPVS